MLNVTIVQLRYLGFIDQLIRLNRLPSIFFFFCRGGERGGGETLLAYMFCFPILDHVLVPQGNFSFKYHPIHVLRRTYVPKLWKDQR